MELLIVIGILTIISVILVLILNPVEYLRRARDSRRLKDYALINQAVNFYSYNSSVKGGELDLDGPNYSGSCVNDGDPAQRLFVSVPSDSGEGSPTPPDGWTYTRANSAAFRGVDGSGWLPINFTDTSGGIQPLNILPVDPTNTFESGFYYTYTCGSYELNMRFESEKYQELAENDSGTESGVYELGSDLTIAPVQTAYHPVEASLDAIFPTVSITSPASGASYTAAGPVNIQVDASDDVGVNMVTFYKDGVSQGFDTSSPYEFTWNITSADNGTYKWHARAFDAANNMTMSSEISLTVNIPVGPQTITLYPSLIGTYTGWVPFGGTATSVLRDGTDTTYISGGTNLETRTFGMEQVQSPAGNITAVRWNIRARDTNVNSIWEIRPYMIIGGQLYGDTIDEGPIIPLGTVNDDFVFRPYMVSFSNNPISGSEWSWSDVNSLEAGVMLWNKQGSGSALVSELYLEVDY
ncbi:MAG: Ig-like domain-containing protein [Candidatus Liptonbacteria bacterium]|nr:Ig-like domain-containing protein [Candidatus Liptonbacteria bacterium]